MQLDRSNQLMCEGVVGDGCGGGRIFFIRDGEVFAHDPMSQEDILLFCIDKTPKKLTKKACILYLEYEQHAIEFDLKTMSQRVTNF